MNAADSIRELTLPVVLISANGLICLALYNRLAAVTSRIRAFCRERFEMQLRLTELNAGSHATPATAGQLLQRLEVLDRQRESLVGRAYQLRNALVLMLGGVIGFLATSLLIGIAERWNLPAGLPLAAFGAATLTMIAGVAMAICELWTALDPVVAEEGLDLVGFSTSEIEAGIARKLRPLPVRSCSRG